MQWEFIKQHFDYVISRGMGTWNCVTGGTSYVGTGVKIPHTISGIIHLYYISDGQFSWQGAQRSKLPRLQTRDTPTILFDMGLR